MKKLELVHLTTYLPYNLKLVNYLETHIGELKGINTSFDISIAYDEQPDLDWSDNNLYYHDKLQFKPILRPLSDLIKEVEISGKKIIPIIELAKLEYPNYKELVSLEQPIETDFNYTIQFKTKNDMTVKMRIGSYNKNGMQTILDIDCYGSDGKVSKMFSRSFLRELVIKWHFDIYCLIDHKLAIDINTLKK